MVTEVPGYTLRGPLGTGPSSHVWRGEAVGSPGRVLAIKLVHHAIDRAARDAVHHEHGVLGRLSHPGILPIVAIVTTGDGLALVMPYASRGSLATTLAHQQGGLSPGVVADIGARLASALAAMHGAGVVHGGIRPANVLFDRERQPLLADAGMARLRGGAPTIAGTAQHLDPELVDGGEPDARSDLYALGATLYEALAGVPPYAGSTTTQTGPAESGRFVPLADRVEAPRSLTAAIEAALVRDRPDRPDGAQGFAAELEAIRRVIADADPPPHPNPAEGRAGVLGAVPSATRPAAPARIRRPTPPPPSNLAEPSKAARGTLASAAPGDGARAPRRVPRMLIVAAAIVLVPTGIAITSVLGHDATDTDTEDIVAVDADGTTVVTEPLTTPHEAAPLCAGLRVPDDGREILLADIEGDGCSAVIAWDGRRMEVMGADGSAERYDLGAGPHDVLRFGDWSCDGRDAPALYRPADGRLFTFDAIAGPGDEITVTGLPTGVADGIPTVVTDADGCDRMEVAPS